MSTQTEVFVVVVPDMDEDFFVAGVFDNRKAAMKCVRWSGWEYKPVLFVRSVVDAWKRTEN